MIALLVPSIVFAQATQTFPSIEDIRSLRTQGKYDEAIEILNNIITDDSSPEDVLEQVYNELIFSLLLKEEKEAAMEAARRALLRFPDLKPDPVYYPPTLGQMYDDLKKEMFGSLELQTIPEACEVYFDNDYKGLSPLRIEYLTVGQYDVNIKKQGYNDEALSVRIDPNTLTKKDVVLSRIIEFQKRKRVRIGVDIGAVYAFMKYKNPGDSDNGAPFLGLGDINEEKGAFRYSFGLLADIALHDRFSLQPGVRYTRLGDRIGFSSVEVPEGGEFNLYYDYVSLPLSFKFYLYGAPSLYLAVGGEPGYLLSARLSGADLPQEWDILDFSNRMNLCMVGNLGIEFKIKNYYLFFAGHYSFGLTSLIKDSLKQAPVSSSDVHTRELKFSTGILF